MPTKIKDIALIGLLVFALAGCAGGLPWGPQQHAGITEWTISPVEKGYKVHVIDGKEKQNVAIKAEKKLDGTIVVSYNATAVKAFEGQALRAAVEIEVAKVLGEILPDIVESLVEAILDSINPLP